MKVFCRTHRKLEEVVGWDKDDPILSCGEIKRRTLTDDSIERCRATIDRFITTSSIVNGISEQQAREKLISDLLRMSYRPV
jgi:hypothetical protein